jgi:hypothetical protein
MLYLSASASESLLPLRRNVWEFYSIRLINLTSQTRFPVNNVTKGGLPAKTNCPTAALNPAKNELKGYPPVKQEYTNCTAPTYMRKTRKASMIKSEFGVFSRYEFQRSAVAVWRREMEREGDDFVADREGIEVPAVGTMSV